MDSKKEFISSENIRLDSFLSKQLDQSRNQVEQLIKKGFVQVDGKTILKTGLKLKNNQNIVVTLPVVIPKEALEVDFDIPIVYEDQYILVINKPSGVIVHDAPSVNEPTLVDWLKKHNISLSTISGEERHGIVHRLDKGTSGLMVVAKTNEAHIALSKQLETKTMGRYYLAFIDLPLKDDITIEKPIYRDKNNRLKMAVDINGKWAKTSFSKISLSKNEKYELIAAKLYTGRTHQIRVHLASIQRHILGDSLYGFKGNKDKIKRVYLHAFSLYLVHPITGEDLSFSVDFFDDMKEFYFENFSGEDYSEKVNKQYIIDRFSSCF